MPGPAAWITIRHPDTARGVFGSDRLEAGSPEPASSTRIDPIGRSGSRQLLSGKKGRRTWSPRWNSSRPWSGAGWRGTAASRSTRRARWGRPGRATSRSSRASGTPSSSRRRPPRRRSSGPHFRGSSWRLEARDAGHRGRRPDHRVPRRPDPPGRRRQAAMGRGPQDGRAWPTRRSSGAGVADACLRGDRRRGRVVGEGSDPPPGGRRRRPLQARQGRDPPPQRRPLRRRRSSATGSRSIRGPSSAATASNITLVDGQAHQGPPHGQGRDRRRRRDRIELHRSTEPRSRPPGSARGPRSTISS